MKYEKAATGHAR